MGISLKKQVSAQSGSSPATKSPISLCDRHTDQCINRYCFDCDVSLCWKCPSAEHKNHHCSELGDIAETIDAGIKTANTKLNDIKSIMQRHDEERKLFNADMLRIEKDICDKAEELKNAIDSDKRVLLKQLSNKKQCKKQEFNSLKMDMENSTNVLEGYFDVCQLILNKSSYLEMFLLSRDVQQQQRKQVDEISYSSAPIGTLKMKFTPMSMGERLSDGINQNLVGDVTSCHQSG